MQGKQSSGKHTYTTQVGELKEAVSGNFCTGTLYFQLIVERTQVLHTGQLEKTPYIKSVLGVNLINKNLGHPMIFTKAPEVRGRHPG